MIMVSQCYTVYSSNHITIVNIRYKIESPSKGHFGTSYFVPCREAVLFLEVEMYCIAYILLGKLEVSLVERLSLSWRVLY